MFVITYKSLLALCMKSHAGTVGYFQNYKQGPISFVRLQWPLLTENHVFVTHTRTEKQALHNRSVKLPCSKTVGGRRGAGVAGLPVDRNLCAFGRHQAKQWPLNPWTFAANQCLISAGVKSGNWFETQPCWCKRHDTRRIEITYRIMWRTTVYN